MAKKNDKEGRSERADAMLEMMSDAHGAGMVSDAQFRTVIELSPADFELFVSALEAPGAPAPELVELFKCHAPWEQDGSH